MAIAQAATRFSRVKGPGGVSPARQNRKSGHWFMAPARLESDQDSQRRKSALGLPQHSRKTSQRCPAGCLSAFEPTKGPGAADSKFLQRKRQARLRNFKSKNGARIPDLPVPFVFRSSYKGCRNVLRTSEKRALVRQIVPP